MRAAAAGRRRSIQFPQIGGQALDILFILIDAEADTQDVTANVGNAVPRLEIGVPALRIGAAEREKARVRPPIERVQKIRISERRGRMEASSSF